MADKSDSDVSKLSFEEALKELEAIVAKLEQGDVALTESIAIYERGDALRKHCDTLLKAAEAKIAKIATDAGGNPVGTEPLDVD
ncbi:MAG: exodeoxyribonuclease VII small subunit [Rhodobiaceae bacterium]|nr:exodeoxyribonuclease VII small subunit [Rhodobiaceae bacterium]